jgi:glycosyltransferase involved in cell wall biosynthesis
MNRQERKVLIVVENLPVPFDRRVWAEATTLARNNYHVSIICPKGKGFNEDYEALEGIHIYRHPLPSETGSALGYLREYATALAWEFRLANKVWRDQGFDVIQICNPPDLLFLVACLFKYFRKTRVVFDHHDITPELYEDKYSKRDLFYHGLRWAEQLSFAAADVIISTNESYKEIALTRGRKSPEDVFVVRSAPDLADFKLVTVDIGHKKGRPYLVGYVGVMGAQDGVDYLLRAVHYLVYSRARQDIQFQLIGGGPALNNLKELARSLQITDFVDFVGFHTGDSLLERLSSCDICVSPDPKTPYNNLCTMNKTLEYMALGKPSVQFDLLEGRRSAGKASLYAGQNNHEDFAEKILQLLDDPELQAVLSNEGKKRMREQFQWRHQIPHLLAAYEKAFYKGTS